MGKTDFMLSFSKTVAETAAEYAPVPFLVPLVQVLGGIVTACQNTTTNRHAASQLSSRSRHLIVALRDANPSGAQPTSAIEAAVYNLTVSLIDVNERMVKWNTKSRIERFVKQSEIEEDIKSGHGWLSECIVLFQVTSQFAASDWQADFEEQSKADQAEVLEFLSRIENKADILQSVVDKNWSETQKISVALMDLMQQGIPSINPGQSHQYKDNLLSLQHKAGELLPNPNLKHGEVQILGNCALSALDAQVELWEGIYLGQEKVTIKLLRLSRAAPRHVKRFEQEAKVWALMWEKDKGHSVLPFYGFDHQINGDPYMVSPYQDQGSIIEYVKRYSDEISHTDLIKGVVRGVGVLHSMSPPIVHGSLSGKNILISKGGIPLLANFGMTQILEDITETSFSASVGVAASFRWSAPELLEGEGTLSTASDIYALGMAILEILTHKPPFSNVKHHAQVAIKVHMGKLPDRPTEREVIGRGLDDKMWELMKSCWAKERTQRPTIREVGKVLGVVAC